MKKIYHFLPFSFLLFAFSGKLHAQCSTASVVPYFESFTSITANNQLPVCWAASNVGNTCLTLINPAKRAAFFDSPIGVNHFYTDGIQLNAGITYSAALWHRVTASQVNWTDLSILVGPNQGPAGLVSIASSNGPVANTAYALLSGTFTVNSSGVYHIAVRGTSNASASNYLEWDDLSITIPCGPGSGNNTPTLSIAGSGTMCTGTAQGVYTVSGGNMYNWNTGANTNTVAPSAGTPGSLMLSVQGTNVFTGCASSASINIMVFAAPILQASASQASVCPGESTTLNATGNPTTFSWSTGSTSPNTTVAPTQATTYTVTGTGINGCKTSALVSVKVFPIPTVSASASYTNACEGDEVTFSASGASTYTWMAPGGPTTFLNPFIPALLYNGTYTITGSDANGCNATTNLLMNVSACTGIEKISSDLNFSLYPNPGTGLFNLETEDMLNLQLELYDLTGRKIAADFILENNRTRFNIEHESPGIYFLKVNSRNQTSVLKLIKE